MSGTDPTETPEQIAFGAVLNAIVPLSDRSRYLFDVSYHADCFAAAKRAVAALREAGFDLDHRYEQIG